MGCSMPGFPVHHQLLEFAQTQVHRVGDGCLLLPEGGFFSRSRSQEELSSGLSLSWQAGELTLFCCCQALSLDWGPGLMTMPIPCPPPAGAHSPLTATPPSDLPSPTPTSWTGEHWRVWRHFQQSQPQAGQAGPIEIPKQIEWLTFTECPLRARHWGLAYIWSLNSLKFP